MAGEYLFDHDMLILLVDYMAEHDYTAKQIAYAVEKPWKHLDLVDKARIEAEESR